MFNLWDKVKLALNGEMRKKLHCIIKEDCMNNCIDTTDIKYDVLCDSEKCELNRILKKYCKENCAC